MIQNGMRVTKERYHYKQLNGHPLSRISNMAGANAVGNEVLRAQYLTLTDELVAMAEDSRNAGTTPNLIFLDKSARPISQLFRTIWDSMHKEESSKPNHGFLHVDRELWPELFEKDEAGILETALEGIKNRIISLERGRQALSEIRDNFGFRDSGYFDGRGLNGESDVIVIDEINSSGATLSIASAMLELAFPGLKVKSHVWMPARIVNFSTGPGTFQRQMPLWYSDISSDGRGIGELAPGSLVTSSPYDAEGKNVATSQLSRDYRNDFKLMIEELNDEEGHLLFRPSVEREYNDYVRVLRFMNNNNALGALIRTITDDDEAVGVANSIFKDRGYTTRP